MNREGLLLLYDLNDPFVMKPTFVIPLMVCFLLSSLGSQGQQSWLDRRDSMMHRLSQEAIQTSPGNGTFVNIEITNVLP